MKRVNYLLLAIIAAFIACSEAPKNASAETANTPTKPTETTKDVAATLSDADKAAGFSLLFNGVNTDGWHVYQKDSASHWEIAEGVLSTKGGHNDLVSDKEYESFELLFDWKVGKGGNSGVFYMVLDEPKTVERTYQTGVEYQIIDDIGWNGKLEEGQKSGAAYDLYPPLVAAANPAGEWNTGKIVCNKGKIQHFINDKMTSDYVWNSEDYKKRLARSKFKEWPFAKKLRGHIALQDHGQAVAFRNVRIKDL